MSAAARLAIETLSDRVVDLELERDSYRELVLASVFLLHRMTRELELSRKRVHGLVDEIRALRRQEHAA